VLFDVDSSDIGRVSGFLVVFTFIDFDDFANFDDFAVFDSRLIDFGFVVFLLVRRSLFT
jgi:hypothetical protein